MTFEGQPRSLILAAIESAYGISYWSSIVTLVLSCRFSEMLELLYAEKHTPIPAEISCVTLGAGP